jgi:hypothetical protein
MTRKGQGESQNHPKRDPTPQVKRPASSATHPPSLAALSARGPQASNRLGRPLPFHRGRDYAFPKALFLTLIHLTSPVMLASELERRLRASGSSVKSVSCHPGFAGTSLFKNGIYPPLERLVRGPGSSPLVALAATELRRSAPPSIAEAGVEA